MSIMLKLFLTFFKIGAVSFGGGYGMISLIRETVVFTNNWLTESEFMSFIAVAESTPGPISINMATFIGSSQAGVLGSLMATLGVVLPSFIIILIIAKYIRNFLKYAGVRAFLSGVRPCVVGLIISTGFTLLLSTLFEIKTINSGFSIDFREIAIFILLLGIAFAFKKLMKKKISPILMIVISAALGILLYGVF